MTSPTTPQTPRDVVMKDHAALPFVLGAIDRRARLERVETALRDLAVLWFEEYEDETHLPSELIEFGQWLQRDYLAHELELPPVLEGRDPKHEPEYFEDEA